MAVRTRNASQNLLTKTIPCQPGHNIYLNLCVSKHSHASEETICIKTCDNQTPTKPGRNQNAYRHVLSKPLPCRGYKMHLNILITLPHASKDTKSTSTCVLQTAPIQRGQNASQHELTKTLPSQQGHEKNLNMC
jgi:hypothetical protein